MKIKITDRGFLRGTFRDMNQTECSIQKSSVATVDAIWLGVEDANPQIMASVADKINPETGEKTGWIKYEVPDDVLMTTRMHLTKRQVAELLPTLAYFAATGSLPDDAVEIQESEDAEPMRQFMNKMNLIKGQNHD